MENTLIEETIEEKIFDEKNLVHRNEKILTVLSVLCTALMVIGSAGLFMIPEATFNEIGLAKEQIDYIFEKREFLFLFICYPLILMGTTGIMNAQVRSSAVKLSRHQFPDIYKLVESYSEQLNMKKVPDVYLVQQNGVLNAFASKFLSRNYIQINSSIFEVAYNENKDMDALGFILGHEMGHIKRGHVSYRYNIATLGGNAFLPLGWAHSRAREYTCDRYGAYLSPHGKHGLFILTGGKHLYSKINVDEYIQNAQKQKGLFMWIENFKADHPVLTKRIPALYNERHGKIF